MQTLSFKYKSNNNQYILEKLKSFSKCSIFLYKTIDQMEINKNNSLYTFCKRSFNLNDVELRSIISFVKQQIDSFNTKKKQTKEEIIDLKDYQSKLLINKLSRKNKETKNYKKIIKELFNIQKKIDQKEKFLKSEPVFGSKRLLQRLSFLCNDKQKNYDEIIKIRNEYKTKRLGNIYIVGDSQQKGNQYFTFDFQNNKIIYKPKFGIKIEINLLYTRKNINLVKLQQLINNKEIPITVQLSQEKISIIFDEGKLSGYFLNEKERNKEVKNIKETDKFLKEKLIKNIYIIYYKELENKQLEGKISNRYLGIDLNPDNIGCSIIDKINEEGDFKIIKTFNYSFKNLTKKSGKSSDNKKSIYYNNKRKHERSQVINHIFKIMKYYKCAYFVMEDLEFKDSRTPKDNREFNRKVKNIWDRTLLTKLINKKCTEGGYQLILVNPIFTSIIGNFNYHVFDPVASSIEITRRGCFKYNKGLFYPKSDLNTNYTKELVASKKLHIDVNLIKDKSWVEIQTTLRQLKSKHIYRWGEKVGITNSLSLISKKSKVTISDYKNKLNIC